MTRLDSIRKRLSEAENWLQLRQSAIESDHLNIHGATLHHLFVELDQARSDAAHLLDLLAESEWVPCRERLPDDRKEVLVWMSIPNHSALTTVNVREIREAWMADGRWLSFQFDPRRVDLTSITHWRPLPSPPKEQP